MNDDQFQQAALAMRVKAAEFTLGLAGKGPVTMTAEDFVTQAKTIQEYLMGDLKSDGTRTIVPARSMPGAS